MKRKRMKAVHHSSWAMVNRRWDLSWGTLLLCPSRKQCLAGREHFLQDTQWTLVRVRITEHKPAKSRGRAKRGRK